MRKRVLKIYVWVLIIGLLYAAWILFTDIKIPCYYLKTLGVQCPGCGTTRMFISMMNLDFSAAFKYNPVMFILFFVWNIIGGLCIMDKIALLRKPKFFYIMLAITIVVIQLYGIMRNL